MSHMGVILACAAVTFAIRLAGFAPRGPGSAAALNRFLGYVPVAVFAALIAPGLSTGNGDAAPRLIGAAAASLAVLRLHHLWSGLAAGMTAYWLARWVM
jgi:branched-subunit amino acid transport protein